MGYNFPDAPTLNQVFGNYTWDGEKWSSGTGYGAIYASDSAPAAPPGSLWYETDTGMLFYRYNDGTSTQWVAIPGGPADAVRYSMPQTLTSAQQSQARSNINVTKRNYIINGGMMISQENGTTAGTVNAYYPADQFRLGVANTTGVCSIASVASRTPGGSTSRLRATVTTADAAVGATDVVYLSTLLEGLRFADLNAGTTSAKTIVLQFGTKAPAGTYGISLRNGVYNRVYVAEYTVAAGEANTDVVKSVTLQLDTTGTWPSDNTSAVDISWVLMGGTTFQTTANTWQAGNVFCTANQFNFMSVTTATDPNRVFELFDVSLTEGSVAPPFQLPDYASELALCQRYWQAPYSGGGGFGFSGFLTAATSARIGMQYRVLMRAAPTLQVINVSLVSLNGMGGTPVATAVGYVGGSNIGAAGIDVTTAASAGTAGQGCHASFQPGSIAFNARL